MASSGNLPLLLAVIASLCAAAVCLDGKPVLPFAPSCSTTDNYTDGSQYMKNLDQLLAGLPVAAAFNGWFYKGTAGAPGTPDQVFGLTMCYTDRNVKECQECLAGAATVCPGSRNVRAAYDACVLRYSPTPSFSIADLDVAFYVTVAGTAIDPERMRNAWLPLMTDLAGRAASSPSRVANATTPYDAASLVYGLAQCTRDLNATECTRCLSSVVGRLSSSFTKETGGAVKAYSCYVRYQLGAFDITLPPEPLW
ncbi:hypothetical protein ACQ4PT_055646 [Festuca glaucescens]